MIPDGYYYKTTQEKKPPPRPKETPVITYVLVSISISIGLTLSISIGLALFEKIFDLNIVVSESEDKEEQSEDSGTRAVPTVTPAPPVTPPPAPTVTPVAPGPSPPNPSVMPVSTSPVAPAPAASVTPSPAISNRICIPRHCNGHRAGSANFRSFPSLSTSAIQGVVPVGECVLLTGSNTDGDGILWYEAINESPLRSSLELDAQNQLEVGQRGWIAACFVDH